MHGTECQKTTDAKHNSKINRILPTPEKLETKAWGQSGMVPLDATSETQKQMAQMPLKL